MRNGERALLRSGSCSPITNVECVFMKSGGCIPSMKTCRALFNIAGRFILSRDDSPTKGSSYRARMGCGNSSPNIRNGGSSLATKKLRSLRSS